MIKKVNLQQTLDRLLAFYEGRSGPGIVAHVDHPPPDAGRPPENADQQKARVRECLILEKPWLCVEALKRAEAHGRDSLSDHIPAAYPTSFFGEAIWSAMLGGEIVFAGTDTSTWSHCPDPPLKQLEKFSFPRIDARNLWFRRMLDATKYFAANSEPVCDVTPFIFYDCLNLLVELRGAAAAYTDLYDYPEMVGRFVDWSVDVNRQVFDAQAALLAEFTEAAFGAHPFKKYSQSRTPNLSIDAYGSCDPEIYAKYGLEQHQRIVAHYGGARLHIHGDGRRLGELAAQIKGLNCCFLSDDAGFPPAWTIVGELKKRLHPVPVSVAIPREAFLQGLKEKSLPGGVMYILAARSLSEANAIMEQVFAYKSLK